MDSSRSRIHLLFGGSGNGMTRLRNTYGTTLVELLAGLSLFAALSLAISSSFLTTLNRSSEQQRISEAESVARSLLDLLAYDLRMLGSGMPLGQDGFFITETDLGDANLPLLLNADTDYVSLRINEDGIQTALSADYTPGVASLSLTVDDPSDLSAGDMIYLSDMPVSGENGMMGTITGVAGNTITVQADYEATAAAVFKKGTAIHQVTTVVYSSPDDWSGITRNSGDGDVLLAPGSRFSLEYLDLAGATLALPLTRAVIQNSLSSIRITVSVLSDGSAIGDEGHLAEVSQTVVVRNLVLNR